MVLIRKTPEKAKADASLSLATLGTARPGSALRARGAQHDMVIDVSITKLFFFFVSFVLFVVKNIAS
jgi:hypothetical protein